MPFNVEETHIIRVFDHALFDFAQKKIDNQIWTKITTPQQNTRKQTVRKRNKKGGKKKEGKLPKPLPSVYFFRPLLFLSPTTIYINKI